MHIERKKKLTSICKDLSNSTVSPIPYVVLHGDKQLDESNARLFMPLPEHCKCITSRRCPFVPLAFAHTTFLWHSLSLSLQSEGIPEKLLEDLMARGSGKPCKDQLFPSTALQRLFSLSLTSHFRLKKFSK
jgi:hypothetical protein